jgi:hypothetical protein
MNRFDVYLNMDCKFSPSYITVFCDTCEKKDDTQVLVDGHMTIDMNNEILAITEIV